MGFGGVLHRHSRRRRFSVHNIMKLKIETGKGLFYKEGENEKLHIFHKKPNKVGYEL